MSKLGTFWIQYNRPGNVKDGEHFCVRESDYLPRHYVVAYGNGQTPGEHFRREWCQPIPKPVGVE